MSDHVAIRKSYNNKLDIFNSLREEIVYSLRDSIAGRGLKIDGIESRVKDIDSIIQKCDAKSIDNPFTDLNDLVAARVVCLFRSSLAEIEDVINELFDVLVKDDKVDVADTFGYMSVHYICKLKSNYSGPRYNKIRDIKFEIQVRTICMHAWAAVSHYLTYKSEWDIPDNLKKAFSALSGLFYVADDQFEQVFKGRQTSIAAAGKAVNSVANAETKLEKDTLEAFLVKRYPDRVHSPDSELSKVISELAKADIKTLSELEREVSRAEAAFNKYEEDRREGKFADVGVIRISLGIVNDKYRKLKYKDEKFDEYLKYVVVDTRSNRES